MGLNFSSTYEQIVKLIEQNDINGLKLLLDKLDKEEIRTYCCDSYNDDEFNRSLLHHAVWKDDSTILQILMPYCEGETLEVYDSYGITPLGASINRGNYNAVKMLLEHAADINCDQNGGYLLVRNAIYKNKAAIVELLIQYNCSTKNIEVDDEHGSLLHVATDLGSMDIAKCLIEKGKINPDCQDKWKIRPIHVASAKNRLDILKYLHENGAELDMEDIFGNTPLGWATFCKSEDCITYLRSVDAKAKDFIVPPAPKSIEIATNKETELKEIKTIENIETIENGGSKNGSRRNSSSSTSKTSIPVRKSSIPMSTKPEGVTNPGFNLSDESKAVTSV